MISQGASINNGLSVMKEEPTLRAYFRGLWRAEPTSITVEKNLELILVSNARIPIKYWRPNFRFTGLGDESLHNLTGGEFPKKLETGKKHPIFSLDRLSDGIGFKVCPCSSKRPFNMHRYRYVRKGCRLLHTNEIVDRHSYLVENITLNIPPALYRETKFRGEVPEACIESFPG